MSDVPSNLIPTRITGLPEYLGTSTLGYLPYVIEGNTYKVQFANIAAVGAVPSTRQINTGTGLGGGGDLSANRTLFILPGGVDDSRLTTTGVAAGTYGSAENVPVLTVNAQGRVTSATNTPIVLSNYVPTSRTITAGTGLSGGGDLSANRSFAVNFSSTTPEPLGPGSPGVSTVAARGDHVHPAVDLSDTTETQGVLPLSRGGTGNSLSPVVGAIAYSSNNALYLTPTSGNAGDILVSGGGVAPPFWQAPIGGGTVTSINASGGTTGLTFSGGPITTFGTLTLGGTLAVANGGTGASVAGTARTNLGAAASGANTDITSIALTTGTVSATPTSGTDIVNKLYADSIASGINFHQSVRLATAAALPANTYNNGTSGVGATLTANANGALSVDGVAAVVGNRILVKNEVAQANNGVYTVTQVGSAGTPYILTRATDFDSAGTGVDQIDAGDFFLVTAGSTQSNTSWVQQTPLPIVVGTTAIVFSQFAAPVLYSAGTGLTLAGTVFSITNTGVAASTYGSASSVPVLAINAQGQVTSASNSSISIAASQITSGVLPVVNGGTGVTTSTGTGSVVLSSSPTLVTPTLGAASATSITNALGSAAAPSYTFTGDTNTGMFSPAADTIAFSEGGTEVMRIDSSANVGIGTSAPAARLHVVNSVIGAQLRLQDVTTDATNKYGVVGTGHYTNAQSPILAVGVGSLSASNTVYVGGGFGSLNAATAIQFFTAANNTTLTGTERMRITNAGDVGIGTGNPASTLNVHTASGAAPTNTFGTNAVRITSTTTAAVGVGPSILFEGQTGNTTANYGFAAIQGFKSSATLNDYSGTLAFFTQNNGGSTSLTERMRIDGTGQVGISVTPMTTGANGNLLQIGNPTTNSGSGLTIGSTTTADIQFSDATTGTGQYAGLIRYSHTSDNMGFWTASTERMRITSAGDVGIGIATPDARLHLHSTAGGGDLPRMRFTNGGTGTGATDGMFVGISNSSQFDVWNFENDAIRFATNNAERFRILATGGITSADLADAVGYKGVPQNSQTSSYTLALTDIGKHISITTGGVVVPANGSVAFPIGSTVVIYNNSASNQTISITTDTMYLAGTATTGSRTLAQRGLATCVKVAATTWVISGAGLT